MKNKQKFIRIGLKVDDYNFIEKVMKAYDISADAVLKNWIENDIYVARICGVGEKVKGITKNTSISPVRLIQVKANIPDKLRWEIFERDNFTCQRCSSRKYLQVDHVYPESKGGLTVKNNLQTLCRLCNLKKGNK